MFYIEAGKICGIYQIKNMKNNKRYIGKSLNIVGRWYFHTKHLMDNNHHNHKLQKQFNEYGIADFSFSILEIASEESLIEREQYYINQLDLENDYNVYNADKGFKDSNVEGFTNYINSRWLSDGSKDYKYRIHEKSHKQEIIDKAIQFNVIDVAKSRMTFNRVIRYIEDELGYSIISGRTRKLTNQYTYKIITLN